MSTELPRDPVPTAPDRPAPERMPEAKVQPRPGWSLIWLIPLVALGLAGYLGWQTLNDRGSTITVHFRTADGLTAGQTHVRHKAVDLGTVESIRLSQDMSEVLVRIRMTREADPYLTDRARFWVVRPRFSGGSISGIETLVSGAYIEMDPGRGGAEYRKEFTGLEQPPGVRSDEPGHTFTLQADRLGSLGPGAPVFWRDITVGEVLGYDLAPGDGPVQITVFVRAPYDGYVHQGTRFWNASGVSIEVGATGLHVELASLPAVLSGGVAFETPRDARGSPPAGEDDRFRLYHNQAEADSAGYKTRLPFVTYFDSAVKGLSAGSAVNFLGIQIGTVQDVRLMFDTDRGSARVRVAFEIQPERISGADEVPQNNAVQVAQRMVRRGARAQLQTASYLTGQMNLALDFVPGAAPADVTVEGQDVVIPSQGGGLDNILATVSDISQKLDRLPIDRIAANIDATLQSVRDTVGSPELRQAIRNLQGTLAGTENIVRKADASLNPLFNRLPAITAALESTVTRANRTLAGLDTSYGANSGFQRELERAMAQVGDTARTIRILADFLDRHPEALIRGRAGVSSVQ